MPSTPVRILGLRTLPTAGEELIAVESELRAREICERRARVAELRSQISKSKSVVAEDPSNPQEGTCLNVILKADGVGTLEALEQIVQAISKRVTDITVTIVATSVGDVNG